MTATPQRALVIYVLLMNGFVPSTACSSCPWQWREYGEHCYLMVTEKRIYSDAESYCQLLSKVGRPSHLISVTSAKENAFLKNYTTDVLGEGHTVLWIGLDDRGSEGDFVWIDGSNSPYRDFGPGEPSGWPEEKCVALWSGYTWNDLVCDIAHEFVCKMLRRFQ